MANRIVETQNKISEAINHLSQIENNWNFNKITRTSKYVCSHSGFEEAKMSIRVNADDSIEFTVYDIGEIKFVDGTRSFSFTMKSEDVGDLEFLSNNLVKVLNAKHGLSDKD